jgi:HJR/Mrr/RecB family endonuclease
MASRSILSLFNDTLQLHQLCSVKWWNDYEMGRMSKVEVAEYKEVYSQHLSGATTQTRANRNVCQGSRFQKQFRTRDFQNIKK